MSDDAELIGYINEFWRCIIEILDAQSADILELLKNNGAYVGEDRTFIISLTGDDYDSEVTKILLDSESESKEFLFSEINLIFRGNPKYFSGELSKYIVVSEQEGKDVHCLRVIDTMGLFHSEGVNADDESERVIDMVALNHSDKLLLIDNTHVTDTVKDGNAAVKSMFHKLKWNVSVYIIRTHWDESIEQEVKQASTSRRRSQIGSIVNWEQSYQQVKEKQDELIDTYSSCLLGADKKGKAYIAGVYNAALILNNSSAKDSVLTKYGISYNVALEMFVQDVLQSIQKNGDKVRVREGLIEQCYINPDSRSWDEKSLYRNMVVDCKGHKYWASSVRAVCRKWKMEGMNHDLDIAENNYGFMNIHTSFVIDMRNLAMGVLKDSKAVELNIDDYIVGDADKDQVRQDVMWYLTDGQAFGKEVAKIIGKRSYEDGFKKNTSFCYQYQRLNDMLQYTQDHFFQAEKIVLQGEESELLLENMREALHRCVENYVNAKCVKIY